MVFSGSSSILWIHGNIEIWVWILQLFQQFKKGRSLTWVTIPTRTKILLLLWLKLQHEILRDDAVKNMLNFIIFIIFRQIFLRFCHCFIFNEQLSHFFRRSNVVLAVWVLSEGENFPHCNSYQRKSKIQEFLYMFDFLYQMTRHQICD